MTDETGRVIWITGLSGSGKSTVALAVGALLRRSGRHAVILDGDAVRMAIDDPSCGHDRASRLVNAYRICRFAKLLSDQGATVIVATMSLFHEIHEWNAAHLAGYVEVFLRVPLDILQRRDPKGLYRRHAAGVERDLGGVDLDVEEPRHPHLVVDNDDELIDLTPIAERIVRVADGARPT